MNLKSKEGQTAPLEKRMKPFSSSYSTQRLQSSISGGKAIEGVGCLLIVIWALALKKKNIVLEIQGKLS